MLNFFKQKIRNKFINLVKDALEETKIKMKFEPQLQVSQRYLFNYYRSLLSSGNLPKLDETGYKVFSQFDEDGKLLFIFACIGTINKLFVDIGASDGINSNCSNLALNFGWHGLFIDGNETAIKRGERFYKNNPSKYHFQPKFVNTIVNRENINQIILDAGFSGEVDLLSVDIDGNDYWVWDALECISPNVVIIETHVEFGMRNIVVPYSEDYVYPGKHEHYHGASPIAMAKLAKKKGYRLVGANDYGFNTIYIKDGIGEDTLPEVTVESILKHPRNIERQKLFEEIKDWEYLEV